MVSALRSALARMYVWVYRVDSLAELALGSRRCCVLPHPAPEDMYPWHSWQVRCIPNESVTEDSCRVWRHVESSCCRKRMRVRCWVRVGTCGKSTQAAWHATWAEAEASFLRESTLASSPFHATPRLRKLRMARHPSVLYSTGVQQLTRTSTQNAYRVRMYLENMSPLPRPDL